jgi:hypothetical protein
MIRKVLWIIFAAIIAIACIFKAFLAILGFVLVLVAWLI